MIPVKGRAPPPAMVAGVANPRGFAPKTLIKSGAWNGAGSRANR